jgi:hypothetical protein
VRTDLPHEFTQFGTRSFVMPLDVQTHTRSVTASLNYLLPSSDKPTRYVDAAPAGRPAWNGVNDVHTVAIEDGRPHAGDYTLDRNGFVLLQAPTEVSDFTDGAAVTGPYYREAERIIRAATGATSVLVFDHTIRGPNSAREPVLRVHNDYTVRSAAQRVRDLLPDRADALLRRRFAIINLWRPIGRPVIASPLALCDATSFTDDDLIPTDLVYSDRVGETASVRFSPSHHWVYFSAMRPDEALLIKCHDSADDGRARLSFHSAFADPTTPPDAPPRESIELRTLVFF